MVCDAHTYKPGIFLFYEIVSSVDIMPEVSTIVAVVIISKIRNAKSSLLLLHCLYVRIILVANFFSLF